MMNHDILMLGPLPSAQMEELKERYTLHCLWREKEPEKVLEAIRDKIGAIVATAWNQVPGKLIRALPNLEIIANFGVGTDNIDLEAARARGVPVTNTPDVLTEDTADFAMALLLAVTRRVVEGDIYARTGRWTKKGMMPLGRSLRGKRLGIVGLGRIGRAVGKRAEAFGLEVAWHGPSRKKGIKWPYFKSLAELADAVDFLVVACPGGEKTRHLIDMKILKFLGREGVLINIARGSVVSESDLIDALEGGLIAGAGLDVFEDEPHVPASLARMDNVVLSPHQASATHETRAAMARLVVENLDSYFSQAKLLTPVA